MGFWVLGLDLMFGCNVCCSWEGGFIKYKGVVIYLRSSILLISEYLKLYNGFYDNFEG